MFRPEQEKIERSLGKAMSILVAIVAAIAGLTKFLGWWVLVLVIFAPTVAVAQNQQASTALAEVVDAKKILVNPITCMQAIAPLYLMDKTKKNPVDDAAKFCMSTQKEGGDTLTEAMNEVADSIQKNRWQEPSYGYGYGSYSYDYGVGGGNTYIRNHHDGGASRINPYQPPR